ncbi:SpoIIE family protein phosphatase [Streptomyces sp. 4N509B]|uniref:SpoIIE family protein phosphatase n=1 Tax=Streptomyces sp. 4N509B TaxID=3457413 RepID=UPI003FD2FC89
MSGVQADRAGTAPDARAVEAELHRVVTGSGASMGVLYLLSNGGSELRIAMIIGMPEEFLRPWRRLSLTAPIPASDAARERRLIWSGNHEETARRYPRLALAFPYRFALAAAPLLDGDICWGSLVLLFPATHPPTLPAHERDTILSACERLGTTLRRAADGDRPLSSPDVPHVVPLSQARHVPPAEARAAVAFVDRLPEGCCSLDLEGRITYINATGADLVGGTVPALTGVLPWAALPWLRDPVFEDRYRAAVVSREPTSFTAVRPPDRRLTFHLYPDASGLSVRITPLAAETNGDPARPSPAPAYSPPSPEPIRPGALYHLMHLAAAFTEAVSVQDVVDLAAEHIMSAFDLQGWILLVSEGGRLRVRGHRGYEPEAVEWLDGQTGPAPATAALASQASRFYASPGEMEREYPGARTHSDKAAWAYLPLTVSGQPVGTCVLSYDHPHHFSHNERAAMTSVAGLLAQALDRALLYDAKHQLAHRLQAGLLPDALPEIPGLEAAARYLPATPGIEIGGDFYDLIGLDAAGAAATIGDVQGHNVTAAALMGQVRTAVHATAGAAPGDVLARTNRLLTDLDPGLFISCLYVHLDLGAHRARLSTAGHIPPLVSHPDGRVTPATLSPGLLLGIDATADYHTSEIPLLPGTMLVLYTDGLVETPGVDLDTSTAQLAARIRALRHQPLDELADTLVRDVERSGTRSDDIALLLLRTPAGTMPPAL